MNVASMFFRKSCLNECGKYVLSSILFEWMWQVCSFVNLVCMNALFNSVQVEENLTKYSSEPPKQQLGVEGVLPVSTLV